MWSKWSMRLMIECSPWPAPRSPERHNKQPGPDKLAIRSLPYSALSSRIPEGLCWVNPRADGGSVVSARVRSWAAAAAHRILRVQNW